MRERQRYRTVVSSRHFSFLLFAASTYLRDFPSPSPYPLCLISTLHARSRARAKSRINLSTPAGAGEI
jgi:hypothetical protein